MLLLRQVVCDPPLGQFTVIPTGQDHVQFTLLIETSKHFAANEWEALLWHNADQDDAWSERAFEQSVLNDQSLVARTISIASPDKPKIFRRHFTATLPRPVHGRNLKFTFKYRLDHEDDWRWANEQLRTSDGEICFQEDQISANIATYLEEIPRGVSVLPLPSDSPGAHLWDLKFDVSSATEQASSPSKRKIGKPSNNNRWFACIRKDTSWLEPRHGKDAFSLREKALLCSFLRYDGIHVVLLALSGHEHIRSVLESDKDGNVQCESLNYQDAVSQGHILVAAAKTYGMAAGAVMYKARSLVTSINPEDNKVRAELQRALSHNATAKWMQNWYDGLTYCTWNSLGQDLTEDKIIDALNQLKENDISVTNLIIDDNWQSLRKVPENDSEKSDQGDLGWSDFEANPKGFPRGLKHTATTIRERFPDIQHIAVWHAILGYWGALDPKGKIARDYKTKTIPRSYNREMTVVATDDVDRMYDDFYEFLLGAGIDAVKTDAQFMLDEIADARDRLELINATQDAWIIAALRYFSIKAISCMSQFPDALFHNQLPNNKPCFLVRNSDDFFPEIPSSHPWHIFINAHNSLFTSYLNVIPDWDMFQTDHEYAYYHAAARCISGGPVYITDTPGKHNVDLINQMTAKDVRGKTVVLRPSVPGKSVDIYNTYDDNRLLKVGAFWGGQGGTSFLAVFNVSEGAILELVSLNSFPGIEIDQEYIVRGFNTDEVSGVMSTKRGYILSVELDNKGVEIFSAVPLRTFDLGRNYKVKSKVGILGLLDKMTGAAAVTDQQFTIHGDERLDVQVDLKALGRLGIYISDLPELDLKRHFLILLKSDVVPLEFIHVDRQRNILEIDLETAWKVLKLEPGFSNEVTVQLSITIPSQ